jgi:hypothetical protein
MIGRVRSLHLNRVSIFAEYLPKQKTVVGNAIIAEVNALLN